MLFFEHFILGAIQGIAEWLPVSSEGLIVLASAWFSDGVIDLSDIIRFSLFLHLGTFFAALVYLRRDVWKLLQGLFWHTPDAWTCQTTRFLIISTGISGIIGIVLLYAVGKVAETFKLGTRGIMAAVGILLVVTGLLQLKKQRISGSQTSGDLRRGENLTLYDGVLLGLAQGISVLPGISRSGITVAALLMRRIDDVEALRLSFLMSLPIVFAGNIAINAMFFTEIKSADMAAFVASFVFGILTIYALLRVARRMNFGWFAVMFGCLTFVSIFF